MKKKVENKKVKIETIKELYEFFSSFKLIAETWKSAPLEIIKEMLKFTDDIDYNERDQEEFIEHSKVEVSIDLSKSLITSEDIIKIATILKEYNNIKCLKIPYTMSCIKSDKDNTLLPLFDVLEFNTSLEELYIIGCSEIVTRERVMYAELCYTREEDLKDNEYQETIYPRLNKKVSDKLIKSLMKNVTLKKLILYNYELNYLVKESFRLMLVNKMKNNFFEIALIKNDKILNKTSIVEQGKIFDITNEELEKIVEATKGPRLKEPLPRVQSNIFVGGQYHLL